MQAVLEADRRGAETWEMYCFQHGLPTAHVGSWLPSTGRPACGNRRCATLANEHWPAIRDHGRASAESWLLRLELECPICRKERTRRCCVLGAPGTDNDRHLQEPFAHAPFVHPFNAPKYHAQQLRAVNFAKATHRQVLWVPAHDAPVTKGVAEPVVADEAKRERWLEFHDRATGESWACYPSCATCRCGSRTRWTGKRASSSTPAAGSGAGSSRRRRRPASVRWNTPRSSYGSAP